MQVRDGGSFESRRRNGTDSEGDASPGESHGNPGLSGAGLVCEADVGTSGGSLGRLVGWLAGLAQQGWSQPRT